MSEQNPPQAESEIVARLKELPSQLGLEMTLEIQGARAASIEAMAARDWNEIKRTLGQYQAAAEQIIEQLKDDAYRQAQIALIIDTGLMWREAGKLDSYAAELFNARTYAGNMGYNDIYDVVNAARIEVDELQATSEVQNYTGPPTEEIVAIAKRELPIELHQELDYLLPLDPEEALEQLAAIMIEFDIPEPPEDFFDRMGWVQK